MNYTHDLEQTPAWDYLLDRGLEARTIYEAGLGYVRDPEPGHERFEGWLSIPYKTGLHDIRGYRFRRVSPGEGPKYLQPRGSEAHLYNIGVLARADRVYLCEGELDCLILTQLGLDAVAIPGVNNWKSEWRLLFAYADEVRVVFDADPEKDRADGTKFRPGAEGAFRVLDDLAGVVQASIVDLPEGEDVNSLYLRDTDELLRRVAA